MARWGILLLVLNLIPLLLSLGGGLDSRLELFTHLVPFYLCGLSLTSLMLLCAQRWKWLLASLLALLYPASLLLPWYVSQGSAGPSEAAHVRILQANVLSSNASEAEFIDYVREAAPDVISVQEINARWAKALKALDGLYPHRFFEPREDNFGIGLLSKYRLEDVKVVGADAGIPAIAAHVLVGETRLDLLLIHTLPPIGRAYAKSRNNQLEYIHRWSNDAAPEAVVVGDLNCTMWSPYYAKMMQRTRLKNARQGFGILGSWPAFSPIRLPLDHVLVQGRIIVENTCLGPKIGSDHLPVLADLRFPQP